MGKQLLIERIIIVLVSIATVCAVAVFATTLVHASFFYQTEEEVSPAQAGIATSSTPVEAREVPTRLRIPAIGVDANVQHVGIGKSGSMAVPTNFTDVGWYRYGPAPGQLGSAVIDGHVDNGLNLDAVFKHISELKPGDDIYVDSASSTTHFVVADVETYPATAVPLNLLFNRNDQARLNLVTCAGTWIQDKKMYDERTVVYTTLAQ